MNQPPVTVPDEARLQRPDAPRLTREVFDHKEQNAAYGFNPQDGLPRPVAETSTDDTLVLPLHPDTFICMADRSAFLLREPHTGEVLAEFKPGEVLQHGDRYSVPHELALDRVGPERAHLVQVSMSGRLAGSCPVEPRRRPCKHYARQMTDFEGRPRGFVARICLALRDESGEYQSLRDTGLYACELRDPPDPQSSVLLDEFDARKQIEGRERLIDQTGGSTFDVEAALTAALGESVPPNMLLGNWMPRDAIPATNHHMHADAGLVLAPDGGGGMVALDLLRDGPGQPWSVLTQDAIPTCAHSRHWPRMDRRDEYVFVTWSGLTTPRMRAGLDPYPSGPDRCRIFRVSGVTVDFNDREALARWFDESILQYVHRERVALLSVIEETEIETDKEQQP